MTNKGSNVSTVKATVPKASRPSEPAKDLLKRASKLALKDADSESLDRALALLRKAASKGSGEAEYAIGTWYGFGKHLPQSDEKAIQHFKRAARKKYGPALFNLASSYETGRGVRKDLARAFSFYVQAAREGDLEAANAVHRCLYHGIGVPRNKPLAELVADFIDGTFSRRKK
jgi:TPR repeat protein